MARGFESRAHTRGGGGPYQAHTKSGTNASSPAGPRVCVNASRNPDGLIQCTILRLHRCGYVLALAPGRSARVVLSAVENALLQDFTTTHTYEEPLSRASCQLG